MKDEKKEMFYQEICSRIYKELGEAYHVEIKSVLKNNGVKMDGLAIWDENSQVFPNLYLESVYRTYILGTSIEEIIKKLLIAYEKAKLEKEQIDTQCLNDFNQVKPFLIYRFVNWKDNEVLLQTVPYIKILDLAVTFHYLLKKEEDEIATIRITNSHMQQLGVTTIQLYKIAIENTPNIFPPVLRQMDEVMNEAVMNDFYDMYLAGENSLDAVKEAQEQMEQFGKFLFKNSEEPYYSMYILSNKNGINGAGAMLYPGILKQFSSTVSEDFYILPSSIHEGATRFAA